jgi:hypothetical protein
VLASTCSALPDSIQASWQFALNPLIVLFSLGTLSVLLTDRL